MSVPSGDLGIELVGSGLIATGSGTDVSLSTNNWLSDIIVGENASLALTMGSSSYIKAINTPPSVSTDATVYVDGSLTITNLQLCIRENWGAQDQNWVVGLSGKITLDGSITLDTYGTPHAWNIQTNVNTTGGRTGSASGFLTVNDAEAFTKLQERANFSVVVHNMDGTTSLAQVYNYYREDNGNIVANYTLGSYDLTWLNGTSVWSNGMTSGWTRTVEGAAVVSDFANGDNVTFVSESEDAQAVVVNSDGVVVSNMSVDGKFAFRGGSIQAGDITAATGSEITLAEGIQLRTDRLYTAAGSTKYWEAMKEAGDLISTVSGEGELVFAQAQNWQPGWNSTQCDFGAQLKLNIEGVKDGNGQVISERNVVFEQGLTLMGAYQVAGCDQQFNIKDGANVTIKGQDFHDGRTAVSVSGGSLTVEKNLLIGFREGSNNYAAAVTLSGTGKLAANSIVGVGGSLANNTFTMSGGVLTITGDTAFTLADTNRQMTVSLTGGTIKTTQDANLVGVTDNSKLKIADIGGVAFEAAKDTTFTFNRSITQAGDITLKGDGGFSVASGSTVTVNSGALKADTGLGISGTVALGSGSGSVVADGGKVTLSGTGAITGDNVTVSTKPTRAAGEATLENVTVSNAGISGESATAHGSIKDGAVSLASGTSVSYVDFQDTNIDIAAGATIDMKDVVFGTGTQFVGDGGIRMTGGTNTVVLDASAIAEDGSNVTLTDNGVTVLYTGLGAMDFGSSTFALELTHDFIVALQKEVLPGQTDVLTIDFGTGVKLTDAVLNVGNVSASYLAVDGITAGVKDDGGVYHGVTVTFQKADAIPEPATAALSLLALAGLAARRRRKH